MNTLYHVNVPHGVSNSNDQWFLENTESVTYLAQETVEGLQDISETVYSTRKGPSENINALRCALRLEDIKAEFDK